LRLAQPVGNLINHRAEGPSVRFIIVWKSSELYREPRRAGFLFMVGPNRNIARGCENFSAHLDRVFRISPWKLTSRSVHSFRLLLSYLSLPRKLGKSNGSEGRGGGGLESFYIASSNSNDDRSWRETIRDILSTR